MRLKMRYGIPFTLEHKLCTKFGFAVEKKEFNQAITFVKHKRLIKDLTNKHIPSNVVPISNGHLTEALKSDLMKRCDNIVDYFQEDPYKVVGAIRQRLFTMCGSLTTVAQRQFVLDWVEENFPESLVQEAV